MNLVATRWSGPSASALTREDLAYLIGTCVLAVTRISEHSKYSTNSSGFDCSGGQPGQHSVGSDRTTGESDDVMLFTLDEAPRTVTASTTAAILAGAAALQVVLGGMRFVDGSMLLQFSQVGFQAQLQDSSQYLFDSPLKIVLLRLLHLDSATAIGLLFIALNFLPLAAIWLVARQQQERLALLAIVTIMPIWKVMFQNIGVGDSVVIACTIVLVMARCWPCVGITTFAMVLWHFQQGMLICLILSVLCIAAQEPERRPRIMSILLGAAAATIVFSILKVYFMPSYTDRLGVNLAHMGPSLRQNLLFFPIGICAIVPGTLLIIEAMQRGGRRARPALGWMTLGAIGLAICVGAIIIDFSRVTLLLTFPIVLFLANPRAMPSGFFEKLLTPRAVVPVLAVAVMTPMLAWSGIEVYLWPTVLVTFQKYFGAIPW